MYHYLKHCRLIDKEINETCNDFKGHGEECHAFCERRFEGRVKVPITRVLGGDRFDVVFEACVGNYWKRPEIMQWLWLVLPLPKSDSIMQRSLYIILRSTEMIAQLRIGAIFFFPLLFHCVGFQPRHICWSIGNGVKSTWRVLSIVSI